MIDDDLNSAIGALMGYPRRDFRVHPLTQQELMAVIETFTTEAEKPHLREDLVDYYHRCLEILKEHILWN
jgi:hypothetical protein